MAVGLGRTPHGRVLHRFGILDEPVGEAVLLTALTRSRERTTVASCFAAEDLDPARLRSDGARLLHEVLAVAQTWEAEPVPVTPLAQPDPLVADLRDRLAAAGLPVTACVADPRWPLDLAVGDPRIPGRQIMAVDLDSPAYAARRSVRERDRHRRERFERAGWTYCRVAAMDLFLDPDAEVARLVGLWEAALGEPVTSSLPVVAAPVVAAPVSS